ncbi:MAG: proteasome accessory factor PafA2 family protein [Actinomycetaceae bacterium]|nr:proteasome accessory factor PafA2 family protein [Actinomycetaceae bacterium]
MTSLANPRRTRALRVDPRTCPVVMGIETEYGILATKSPLDVQKASEVVVDAYEQIAHKNGMPGGIRWDYSGERPLDTNAADDLRPEEVAADIDPVTRKQLPVMPLEVVRLSQQEEKFQRAHNLALPNGARFYVDHSHPEYACPETTSALYATACDVAGERIVAEAAALAGASPNDIRVFKNNTDGQGQAYGCHENYLLSRKTTIDDLIDSVVPFFVTRPLFAGAGRVGIGTHSQEGGFQISQRADFVEIIRGLHTTVNRPIINTRDEPHSSPDKYRRFHYIGGDATCFPFATWLRLCVTSMVLRLVDERGMPNRWRKLRLADPVEACRTVSRDLCGREKLELEDGRKLYATQIQLEYIHEVANCQHWNQEELFALQQWQQIIHTLCNAREADKCEPPAELADRVEWVARHQLISTYLMRNDKDWNSDLAKQLDLRWCDLTEGQGLAAALIKAGRTYDMNLIPLLDEVFVDSVLDADRHFDALVEDARYYAPPTTRAYFRGELIRHFPGLIPAASWHSIVIDHGDEYCKRICLADPLQWTQRLVGDVVEEASEKHRATQPKGELHAAKTPASATSSSINELKDAQELGQDSGELRDQLGSKAASAQVTHTVGTQLVVEKLTLAPRESKGIRYGNLSY